MPNQNPMVSVCMIAYNVEPFIGKAIEGVLRQKANFPFELVIGEDCSKDGTMAVCTRYMEQYPDIIRLLPSGANLGMAGNYARTVRNCRGKYIAVCDSDDIWVDPSKLQQQIDFLEANPDYGAVYTDVETISENNEIIIDSDHEKIRTHYAEGNVFFKLLHGNFINHPTAVYRRLFVQEYEFDGDRNYYNYDHLLWLHIAVQSKICFINTKTTHYRKHSGSATSSTINNKKKFQFHLYKIIRHFDKNYTMSLNTPERSFIFQKTLSILYRKENNMKMKIRILPLLPKYFPGVLPLTKFLLGKIGFQWPSSLNNNNLTTNLE